MYSTHARARSAGGGGGGEERGRAVRARGAQRPVRRAPGRAGGARLRGCARVYAQVSLCARACARARAGMRAPAPARAGWSSARRHGLPGATSERPLLAAAGAAAGRTPPPALLRASLRASGCGRIRAVRGLWMERGRCAGWGWHARCAGWAGSARRTRRAGRGPRPRGDRTLGSRVPPGPAPRFRPGRVVVETVHEPVRFLPLRAQSCG